MNDEQTVLVKIEVNELAGYELFVGNKKVNWEDLTRIQQIHVLNSFVEGYNLFSRHLRNE